MPVERLRGDFNVCAGMPLQHVKVSNTSRRITLDGEVGTWLFEVVDLNLPSIDEGVRIVNSGRNQRVIGVCCAK